MLQDRTETDAATNTDFETLYRSLEETVEHLSAGGLNLEESIDLYERGMRLAQRCKQLLDSAELRISELQEEFASDEFEHVLSEEPC